jgi:hypothetical protein
MFSKSPLAGCGSMYFNWNNTLAASNLCITQLGVRHHWASNSDSDSDFIMPIWRS